MKIPQKVMRYCPFCSEHTEHRVKKVKGSKASEMRKGQRRFRRVTSGYGGFPRPKVSGGAKITKKTNLKYECSECGKAHNSEGVRTGRLEIER